MERTNKKDGNSSSYCLNIPVEDEMDRQSEHSQSQKSVITVIQNKELAVPPKEQNPNASPEKKAGGFRRRVITKK